MASRGLFWMTSRVPLNKNIDSQWNLERNIYCWSPNIDITPHLNMTCRKNLGDRKKNRKTWWRHQMETISALLPLCVGNPPVTGEFPAQRPVTRSWDVCSDLRLNKRLSKQSEAGDSRRHRAHYDVIVRKHQDIRFKRLVSIGARMHVCAVQCWQSWGGGVGMGMGSKTLMSS